jgi:endonuclease I
MKKVVKSFVVAIIVAFMFLICGCDTTIPSPTPGSDITSLDTPSNVLVEKKEDGAYLYFTPVENSVNYVVYYYLGDAYLKKSFVKDTDGLAGYKLELVNEGTYNFSVQALASTITSNLSSKVEFVYSTSSGTITPNPSTDTYISYYNGIEGKTGTDLKSKLRTIISSKIKHIESYGELREDLAYTDQDPNNSNNVMLFYSRVSTSGTWDYGATWNREHIWPQSQGWFKTSGAGADAHHIRPTATAINEPRGNNPYGNVTTGTVLYYKNVACGKVGSSYFEPNDNVKGDVARILFYMMVRYEESDKYSITRVAQSMDVLLEWNRLDPVDSLEITRNERVYEIQGNRNPFIDYASLADLIWK